MKISDPANEWNIKTNIGPITLDIFVDSLFFNHSDYQNSERHKHATFEFHFITKGSGVLLTDNMQYEIVPDSYYIVSPGIYHLQKGSVQDPIHRYSCKFEFDINSNTINENEEEEVKNFVYILSNTKFFYSKNLDQIRNIIYEIQSELSQQAMGYYTKTKYLFSVLFISIIREMGMTNKLISKTALPKIRTENRLTIIDNFFDFHYNYKATSKDLCQLLHISKSQLNRILKDKYNMSFKQKHMEAQIEHIKDMLINTDLPIKDIAEKIGYTSESNFNAFFRHIVGISPSKYREQYVRV